MDRIIAERTLLPRRGLIPYPRNFPGRKAGTKDADFLRDCVHDRYGGDRGLRFQPREGLERLHGGGAVVAALHEFRLRVRQWCAWNSRPGCP